MEVTGNAAASRRSAIRHGLGGLDLRPGAYARVRGQRCVSGTAHRLD